MTEYKYEMHVHTSEGSSDSRMSGSDMVRHYMSLGYAGVCITDHFTGSITRPLNEPWKKQMDVFCSGYEAAAKAAEGTDFQVFFGLEYSDRGNDFLFFNLNKDWLVKNEDMCNIPLKELLTRVRSDGGFIVHAHPFLESDWIEMIRLLPHHVDAVEVCNTAIDPAKNIRADWYADSYNLKKTGGSDLHYTENRPSEGGIIAPRRAKDLQDLTDMIRAGETKVITDYRK